MALLGPSTDYTNKDFDALRARLFLLIESAFPTWSDTKIADFGNLLVELFCFVGDVLTKYQDNQAAEAFWGRVTQRKNILALGKLINFHARGNTSARVDLALSLALSLAGDTPIPARTRAKTENVNDPIIYETLTDAVIPAGSTGPIIVTAENAQLRTELFSSTGRTSQEISLAGMPYLDDSAEITAANGAYSQVDDFLDSTSTDRHYTVVVDSNDRAKIRFGTGTSGAFPSGTITVVYKVGGGASGRVDVGAIKRLEGNFSDVLGNAARVLVTNPAASSVAVDRQSVEEIRALGPRTLRTLTRSVAREDYEINALRVPGVARVLFMTSDQGIAVDENTGIAFVVPDGGGTADAALLDAVVAMFTTTYPKTTTFQATAQTAAYLTIDIAATVYRKSNVTRTALRAAILDRLARAFAIKVAKGDEDLAVGIDFGFNLRDADGNVDARIAWSDVFDVIRDTPGVRRMEPSTGLLLAGATADVVFEAQQFPRLGTVTLFDGDDGNPL